MTKTKTYILDASFDKGKLVVSFFEGGSTLQSKANVNVSWDKVHSKTDPLKSVDLYYDIVYKHTDWPTYNYSIKTLAQHLGFKWRDENPSGAASIQWFSEWCQFKKVEIFQRILDYNEDDCKAMVVVKDKLLNMIKI